MSEAARALYDRLRALENRAYQARGRHGTRREAVKAAGRPPYSTVVNGQRISSWLPEDPDAAQVPSVRSADQVWALVRVWSDWAGDKPPNRSSWDELIEKAQPARFRRVPDEPLSPVGTPASLRPPLPGRTIGQWDPVDLGIHKAIGGDALPGYFRRRHDDVLDAVLDPLTAANRLVVLRGASSTGKSRAAYEAIMKRMPGWQVDYPRTPSGLASRLRDGVRPRTVLWLGELRRHAEGPGAAETLGHLSEFLAAHGQVVVITTLWHEQWAAYTAYYHGAPGISDPWAHTRDLLTPLPELADRDPASIDPSVGGVIDIPLQFSEAELAAARRQADAVLSEAIAAARAAHAEGQVIQFLAGADHLLGRLAPGGNDYGRALITAAMDLSRFGRADPYPRELLQRAMIGYLSNRNRTSPVSTWWAAAHEYATEDLKGEIRALEAVAPEEGIGVVGYKLADYLAQYGRRSRQSCLGPRSLWEALAADVSASPGELRDLGDAANIRGLSRYAAIFYTRAITASDTLAALLLLGILGRTDPDSVHDLAQWADRHIRQAWQLGNWLEWLYPFRSYRATREEWANAAGALANRMADRVTVDDPTGVTILLRAIPPNADYDIGERIALRAVESGAYDDAGAFATLLPALPDDIVHAYVTWAIEHVRVQDPQGAAEFLEQLRALEDRNPGDYFETYMLEKKRLASRAADEVALGDPAAAATLLDEINRAKAAQAANHLIIRVARAAEDGDIDPSDPTGVATLLEDLNGANLVEDAARLASMAAEHSVLHDPKGAAELLAAMNAARLTEAATALAARAARDAALGAPDAVSRLLDEMNRAGLEDAAAELVTRVVRDSPISDSDDITPLLNALRPTEVTALASRAANSVSSATVHSLGALLDDMRGAGHETEATALMFRAVGCVDLGDSSAVARLLRLFIKAGAQEPTAALLGRHPVDHAAFNDAAGIAELIGALRIVGAEPAAHQLAVEAASRVVLADAGQVVELLEAMTGADAAEAATALAIRAASEVAINVDGLSGDDGTISLVRKLHDAGMSEEATLLSARAADAGLFHAIINVNREKARFPFGREPDGAPSSPWKWQDILRDYGGL